MDTAVRSTSMVLDRGTDLRKSTTAPGKRVDFVPAIAQYTGVAVDVTNLALARDDAFQPCRRCTHIACLRVADCDLSFRRGSLGRAESRRSWPPAPPSARSEERR